MEKQEKQAIEILHMMCGNNGCVISDSGGKDSSVLKHIALKVKNRYGLEYKIRHNHTTVDAPETVYFIRREKEKYTYEQIEKELNTGKDTPRRWITAAVKELAVMIYGIE